MRLASKICFLAILCLSTSITLKAQGEKKEITPTFGFITKHSELGYGAHFGFNLCNNKERRIKSDFQFSINFADEKIISSGFLSLNTLYGAKYYLTKSKKTTSVYLNTLIGAVYVLEFADDFTERLLELGYSVGCFARHKRVVIGVSAESYRNLILKLGYTL